MAHRRHPTEPNEFPLLDALQTSSPLTDRVMRCANGYPRTTPKGPHVRGHVTTTVTTALATADAGQNARRERCAVSTRSRLFPGG